MPIDKNKKKTPKTEDENMAQEVEIENATNRLHSDTSDQVNPKPHDKGSHKKKKKKKRQLSTDQDVVKAGVLNGTVTEPEPDEEEMEVAVTRRAKRKRKAKSTERNKNESEKEFEGMVTDSQSPNPQHSLFATPHGNGRPAGKVFFERNRRFPAEHEDYLRNQDMNDEHMDPLQTWSTSDIAMKVHSSFRVVGLFSHGFLAGYAVWNIIVVYVLAGEQMSTLTNLLQQYHPLAYPAQSLLYLLLATSTVSAFDRMNLAKASMALRGIITLEPAAVASFLYFIALILSLSQQMTSDRMKLYPTANETLWPRGSEQQILQPWIVVNLVVALLVGVAWAVVSTKPDIDYTEFLMNTEIDGMPRAEENMDIPA